MSELDIYWEEYVPIRNFFLKKLLPIFMTDDGFIYGWAGGYEGLDVDESIGHLTMAYSLYVKTHTLIIALSLATLERRLNIQISKREKGLEAGYNVFKYRTNLATVVGVSEEYCKPEDYERYIALIAEAFEKYLADNGEAKIEELLLNQKEVW